MDEFIELRCSACKALFYAKTDYIERVLKNSKIGKVGRVAHQLSAKRGPYYDRWKAAMDARGEQKRCKDCKSFWEYIWYCPCRGEGKAARELNPGRFACKEFRKYDRGY